MKLRQFIAMTLLLGSTTACYKSDCLPQDPTCQPILYWLYYTSQSSIFTRQLVVHGNSLNSSSVYDPDTHQFLPGPTLSGNVISGAHSFRYLIGENTWQALAIHSSTTTSIWKPEGSEYGKFISGPNLSAAMADGGRSFKVNGGVNDGKFIIIIANGSITTSLFNPEDSTIQNGPPLSAGAVNGNIIFTPLSGAVINQTIISRSTSNTNIYNPTTNTWSAGTPLNSNAGPGSFAFYIATGPQAGNYNIIYGGGLANNSIFSSASNTYSVGTGLSAIIGAGGFGQTLSNGKTLIIHGNSTKITSLYDPTTHTFSSGPQLPFDASNGANCFEIKRGPHIGKYLIVHGNTTPSTALYDPANNTMSSGPSLTANVGVGGNNFEIPVF